MEKFRWSELDREPRSPIKSEVTMALKCPHCGAALDGDMMIIEDDTGQKVCVDCGAVLEAAGFHNEANVQGTVIVTPDFAYIPSGHEHSTLPQAFLDGVRTVSKPKQITYGKRAALRKLKHLIQFIIRNDSGTILQECKKVFNDLNDLGNFKQLSVPSKEILAGCVVYCVCRDHDIPITVIHVCMLLACDQFKFFRMLLKVQKVTGKASKGLDLDTRVDTLCTEAALDDDVKLLVKKILPMVKKAWIMEGRGPDGVIKATCYIAWQSMDIVKRAKCTFPKFAREHNWGKKSLVCQTRRASEIMEMLMTLANAIPWLTPGTVDLRSVLYHLKDIVNYQKTMFLDMKNGGKTEGDSDENESNNEEEIPSNSAGSSLSAAESSTSSQHGETSEGQHSSQPQLQTEQCNEQVLIQVKSEQSDDNTLVTPSSSPKKRPLEGSEDIAWPYETKKRPYITLNEYSRGQLGEGHKAEGPFLPLSYYQNHAKTKAKRVSFDASESQLLQDLDSEEITVIDLTNEEEEQYIRTPQEVLDNQKLQVLLKSEESEKRVNIRPKRKFKYT